jgi:parallel beta-helix repeat protein
MKRMILISGIIVMLFVSNFTFGTIADESNLPNTIYVDDDNTEGPWDGSQEHPYQFIQDGIDNASYGDTVFVFNGFYNNGKIIIRKPISLCGENASLTIIDGNKTGSIPSHDCVQFFTDLVMIANFTIQNGWSGIALSKSQNVTIKNNVIKNNLYGVSIRWRSDNTLVYHNHFTENEHAGILVEDPSSFINNNFIDNGINTRILYSHCYLRDNYWNDWIGLKLPFLSFLPYFIRTVLGFPNFDWHPAKEPYEI